MIMSIFCGKILIFQENTTEMLEYASIMYKSLFTTKFSFAVSGTISCGHDLSMECPREAIRR